MDLLSGINGVEMTRWLGTRVWSGADEDEVVVNGAFSRVIYLLSSVYARMAHTYIKSELYSISIYLLTYLSIFNYITIYIYICVFVC